MSRFEPRATQALTRIDGGKLAAASGQKSSNSRNSCSTLCCTQCHFDSREEAARVTDGGSSTTGVARRANATFGLSRRIAEAAGCTRSTHGGGHQEPRRGVLTWVQRIKRVREPCPGLLGDNGWR